MVFLDERRFKLFPNWRVQVQRTSMEKFLPACVAPAIQQRESCMAWDCITSEGPGMFHFVEGTMNHESWKIHWDHGRSHVSFNLWSVRRPLHLSAGQHSMPLFRDDKSMISKHWNGTNGLASSQPWLESDRKLVGPDGWPIGKKKKISCYKTGNKNMFHVPL